MSKRTRAERRRASRQSQSHANLAHVEATAPHLLKLKRGRPRTNDPVPPTPETLRKLQPDLLGTLVKAEVLTPDEAAAGRECYDAWEVITGPVAIRTRIGGRNDHDSALVERLQRTWRRWADGMMARTHVRYSVVVEWIAGDRACDTDPGGAAGILKTSLRWWQQAGRDVSRGTSGEPRKVLTKSTHTRCIYGVGRELCL